MEVCQRAGRMFPTPSIAAGGRHALHSCRRVHAAAETLGLPPLTAPAQWCLLHINLPPCAPSTIHPLPPLPPLSSLYPTPAHRSCSADPSSCRASGLARNRSLKAANSAALVLANLLANSGSAGKVRGEGWRGGEGGTGWGGDSAGQRAVQQLSSRRQRGTAHKRCIATSTAWPTRIMHPAAPLRATPRWRSPPSRHVCVHPAALLTAGRQPAGGRPSYQSAHRSQVLPSNHDSLQPVRQVEWVAAQHLGHRRIVALLLGGQGGILR